jgi:hypothetical protein
MAQYKEALHANGVRDLYTLTGLEAAELRAMGVKGRRENIYGAEETTSDLDVLLEALRGLRSILSEGANAGGGVRWEKRGGGEYSMLGGGAGAGGGGERGGSGEMDEDVLFKEALKQSLAEYESSTSQSGSAPGSRNSRNTGSGSAPGTYNTVSSSSAGDALGSAPGSAMSGGRRKEKRRGGQAGVLIGLGKVRGLLDVGSLSAQGKSAMRAYCVLAGNRLKIWWGSEVRDEAREPPSMEVLMDGKCVDAVQDGAGRMSAKSLFIRRNVFAVAQDDLHITVIDQVTFVEWLQRLQASAYLFSMAGPSLSAPVSSIVLRVLAIYNASALFQNMSLAVVVAKHSGEVVQTLRELELAPQSKKDMRFEIYKEIKPPVDPVTSLFFEVRHAKNGKAQPTKYWAMVSCQDMEQGDRVLQVYKAPVEYNIHRQRLQPKKDSTLEITFTA